MITIDPYGSSVVMLTWCSFTAWVYFEEEQYFACETDTDITIRARRDGFFWDDVANIEVGKLTGSNFVSRICDTLPLDVIGTDRHQVRYLGSISTRTAYWFAQAQVIQKNSITTPFQ